jgi:hypothetical protein
LVPKAEPAHRDFIRERSPDKTPSQIRKQSVAKVDDQMSANLLEMLKPTDVNYVEERSQFEAKVDSGPVRVQWVAKKNHSLDDFDYIDEM